VIEEAQRDRRRSANRRHVHVIAIRSRCRSGSVSRHHDVEDHLAIASSSIG
jgi:hypothetical protein